MGSVADLMSLDLKYHSRRDFLEDRHRADTSATQVTTSIARSALIKRFRKYCSGPLSWTYGHGHANGKQVRSRFLRVLKEIPSWIRLAYYDHTTKYILFQGEGKFRAIRVTKSEDQGYEFQS